MAADARYRLVYEESVRSLEDQLSNLAELRSRAGILLSAASISASFLGGIAITTRGVGLFAWIGIGSFIGASLLVLSILLPTSWPFDVDAAELLTDYIEADDPADLSEMHRSLALYRQETFDANAARLHRLFLAFRLASLCLVLEILAWLIDLATG
jgi:hypothetical protein